MTDTQLTPYDRASLVLHGPGSEDETALHSRIKGAIEDAERAAIRWVLQVSMDCDDDEAAHHFSRWQEVRGG